MSKIPSYPEEAPVGEPVGRDDKDAAPDASAKKSGPEASKAGKDEEKGGPKTRHLVAGAAIGIGSAALVAALLYTKGRKDSKSDPAPPAKPETKGEE